MRDFVRDSITLKRSANAYFIGKSIRWFLENFNKISTEMVIMVIGIKIVIIWSNKISETVTLKILHLKIYCVIID